MTTHGGGRRAPARGGGALGGGLYSFRHVAPVPMLGAVVPIVWGLVRGEGPTAP